MKHLIHYIIPLALAITLSLILTFKNHSPPPLTPFSCSSTNPSTASLPFCNAGLPLEQRALDLVGRLTLDEKISQLVNKADAIPRLGIPYYEWWSEALHGVAMADGVENGFSFNGTIRAATSFPQVILTAASFDAHLWYRIAKVSSLISTNYYALIQSQFNYFYYKVRLTCFFVQRQNFIVESCLNILSCDKVNYYLDIWT